MKTFLTALAGGVVGAGMVLAVQSGNLTFVKEAYAQGWGNNKFTECFVSKMEDVHTDLSGYALSGYCAAKN